MNYRNMLLQLLPVFYLGAVYQLARMNGFPHALPLIVTVLAVNANLVRDGLNGT